MMFVAGLLVGIAGTAIVGWVMHVVLTELQRADEWEGSQS